MAEELEDKEDLEDEQLEGTVETGEEAAEETEPLDLDVSIESPSACQRHITVTISRDDIDRYYKDAFSEMMGTAAVPGFRAGRAPRKLVESRYRKEATEQIKSSLLLDSMAQINEEQSLAAISEPEIDLDAVEVPEDGPMTFEFDLEVRPEFDLPEWRGLRIKRPSRDFTTEDIDSHLRRVLADHGRLVPSSEPAQEGDQVTANIVVRHDDKQIHRAVERAFYIRPTLSFRDGKITDLVAVLQGVEADQSREAQMTLSTEAPNEELAGKEITVCFEVLDVKKFELPDMTDDFLQEIGDFDSEGDLRDAVKNSLERQLEYDRQQKARQQVTQLLTEAADWELPPELLKRQSSRELERSVLELRRSGFTEPMIQAYANELRQNSQQTTARSLREHFILERIAEDEDIEVSPEDDDNEIALIAAQSGESPRRVRARIEKEGLTDALRNQIVERKVIERVLEDAKFEDVPYQPEQDDVEAIDMAAAGGEESAIPVAQHAEAQELSEPKDHT